ncbi:type IV secretion system protein [Serratia proteamaculans]|uniref:type IV secretion system protein n=1 Tax=Serratia proteamaculans TaxID=28151 RepID=UPI0039AFC284
MKLKTLTAACLAGALLCPSLAGATGIPVVDAMSNLEQVNEWAQHLEQWQGTVQHYQSQLNAYKSQLATATGVRNVQDFLSQAKGLSNDLKNLQKNGISLNDLLTNSGGSYSSALNSLYSKYKMFDTCDATQTQSYADTCKQIVINRAVAVEDTTAVQEKINSTVSDIATLASRVEMSQDAKESQDLANTITSKSVQLNALTTQWEMSVKQSELRDNMLTSQRQKADQQQQLKAPVADLNNL